MTDQEIEKMREKLGPEYSVKRQNGAVTVELADIWKGVEFAECVSDVKVDRYDKEIAKGQIYRIVDWFKREVIYIDNDELGWQSKHFKPSSEATYVEQLKAKAKELYGEIYSGQTFDCSEMGLGKSPMTIKRAIFVGWNYNKKEDSLSLGGFRLYMNGKWAKKVDEPIRVTPIEIHSAEPDIVGDQFLSIQMKIIHGHVSPKNRKDVAYHLAKCLEDYLNKS